jgi:hypothetical protein
LIKKKNPSQKFLCLFQILIDLYRYGTLLIPDGLIKSVLIIEGNALLDVKYMENDVQLFYNFSSNFRKSNFLTVFL